METLFRFHRGGLADSLETTTFVTGLEAIKTYIKENEPMLYHELRNIRIRKEPYVDERLPKEWGSVEYMVVADFDGYKGQCIGFTISKNKDMEENFSHPSKIHISPIVGATMDNGVVIQPVIDDEVGVLQNVTMRFKKLKYGKSFRKKLVHCIRNEKIAQRRAMRKQQEKHNKFSSIN